MSNRIVAVTLSAQVDAYRKGMMEAAQATRMVGTEGEKLAQQRQAFEMLGRTMLTAGGLMAAGVGLAVAKFAEFDQQMSYVAATGEDARENMDALRQAALDAGASTVFTAAESANAIEEMAKAGIDAADILGGALTGALDLAAAGGLGVARAAEVMSTTMQQFSLSGEDATHVADLLAAGAGKAMGDVEDMSAALNQAGLVASQFGLSAEETTGTLSAFASAGMLGSDAGTSFRTMLLRLANPTGEVKELMAELGIEAYDAQGNFVGMANLAGELTTSLRGMSQEQRDAALAMIFGQDAIRGANILLREGEDGIRRWTREVDDQGYAAETAAERLDNLKGDIEALGGAFDSALIGMGAAADGPGRLIVQMLTGMIDGFNEMPAWGQQTVFWMGAVGAAVSLAGGVFFTAIPKVVEYRAALEQLGPAAQRTSRIASAAMKGLTFAAVIAGSVQLAQIWRDQLQPSAEELANALKTADSAQDLFNKSTVSWTPFDIRPMVNSVEDFHKALEIADTEASGFFGWLGANTTFDAGNKVFGTFRDGWQSLAREMASAPGTIGPTFERLRDEFNATDEELIRLIELSPELKAALTQQATEAGIAATGQNLLRIALEGTADKTDDAATKTEVLAEAAEQAQTDLDALRDALQNVGGTAMSMGDAMDAAQGSINDLTAAAAAEEVSLDGTNDASIGLRDSIRDVEQSHRDAAQAILDNGGTFESARDEWNKGREAIINQIAAMTGSRDEAVRWADQNLGSAESVVGALSSVKTASDQITSPAPISLQVMGYSESYNYLTSIQQKLRDITGSQVRIALGPGGQGGTTAYANGGIEDYAFAGGGGIDSGIFKGGPPIYKIAEPETGWEAFISGKPDARDRNIGIWQETGRRLGVDQENVSTQQVGIQPGDKVSLVVAGHAFDAYVQAQAGGVVHEAQQRTGMNLSRGESSR